MYTIKCPDAELEYHCRTKHSMEYLYLALLRSDLVNITDMTIEYFDVFDGTPYDVDGELVYEDLYNQGVLIDGIDFNRA